MTAPADSTFSPEAAERLSAYLATHHIPAGLGTEEEACSIAAINLVLTNTLNSEIPKCMSMVIGSWIRSIQDLMPDAMRNSNQWKALLPLAAGTGRDFDDEQCRRDLIMEWMWAIVLPSVQPVADQHGFGEQWRRMTTARTAAAAHAASTAARAADIHVAIDDTDFAAVRATTLAADSAAVRTATTAAHAAGLAATAINAGAWETFDPPELLARLIVATGDNDV